MYLENHEKEWKNVGCLWVIGAFLLISFIVFIGKMEWEERKNNISACEDIGGKYNVVGQEYSAARKTAVDVYGCIKQ